MPGTHCRGEVAEVSKEGRKPSEAFGQAPVQAGIEEFRPFAGRLVRLPPLLAQTQWTQGGLLFLGCTIPCKSKNYF